MELSSRRKVVITSAILASTFLAATESTIVATAMPTIVGRLGGVSLYAWVFTAFLVTSATTVPIFGKLADTFGRRRVFTVAIGIFLLGSLLCAMAQTMEQLVFFRALQGLGAGGVQPLALTIVGDIFSLELRARIQGMFSAVYGVASIVAPVIGGLIVERLAWEWIFLFNLPVGIVAALLIWFSHREPKATRGRRPIDYLGTLTLTGAIVIFQFALLEFRDSGLGAPSTLGLIVLFVAVTVWFVAIERRAKDPVLPFSLFRNPIIRNSTLGAFAMGAAVFGQPTFVPVLMQGVRGGGATEAGIALIPLSIGWTMGSLISGRVLLVFGYRTSAVAGTASATIASALLALFPLSPMPLLLTILTLFGLGAGLSFTAFVISTQTAVDWSRRGVATSATQFARLGGATLGIAILGAIFTGNLVNNLRDVPGATINIANELLDAQSRARLSPDLIAASSSAIGQSLDPVFVVLIGIAVLAMIPSFFLPTGDARKHVVEDRVPAGPEEISIGG